MGTTATGPGVSRGDSGVRAIAEPEHEAEAATEAADPEAEGRADVAEDEAPAAHSLFGEILDWLLAPLLLVWPMSIAVTYLVAASIANAPFDRSLEESTTVLAQQVKLVDGQARLVLPATSSEILRADETDRVYFQVLGSHGEFIGGDIELPLPPEDEKEAPGIVRFRDDTMRGDEVRVAWVRVDLKTGPGSNAPLVQVAETRGKRAQLAGEIIKGVILPQFVILPIAVVLVWFGLSRGIRPLYRLQQRIAQRRIDDLSPINVQEAPEEVGPLVHSFNQLLARLERNIEDQKRFIADAAHQMRTPLAGLRTQAELAMRQTDPAEIHKSLEQLATGSERATRLINQLLALARAENRSSAGPVLAPLDLEELARSVLHELVPLALEKQIDLGFEERGQPALVDGNAMLLHELVKNLIDNAIHYTPSGGSVTVRIGTAPVPADEFDNSALPADPSADDPNTFPGLGPVGVPGAPAGTAGLAFTIEVEDTGPGIPVRERDLVFERFYRVLGNSEDGSGLGLAIVREIAMQHGATVTLHDNPRAPGPLPGTLVRIRFPRRGAPPAGPDHSIDTPDMPRHAD